MLRALWEGFVFFTTLAFIVTALVLVAGCDAFVADNPVCQNDCYSTQSPTVGG